MNITKIKGKGVNNILILTGIHGNELTPIHCGLLLKEFNWKKLKESFKEITILNAINLDGIKEGVREIPDTSTKDLNRMFSNENKLVLNKELLTYLIMSYNIYSKMCPSFNMFYASQIILGITHQYLH